MLQGQRDLAAVSQLILSELAPLVTAQHGVFYVVDSAGDDPALKLLASYAYRTGSSVDQRVQDGRGAGGPGALEKRADPTVGKVPRDYIQVSSGLGEAPPLNIVVLPVLFEGEVKAVIELASFDEFSEIQLTVPRSAHREHRHRAEHDRRQHADRGAAQAVAGAHRGAAVAAGGAHRDQQAAGAAGPLAAEVRGAAPEAAGRAAADQRGARGEGPAARGTEGRSGAEEQGGRAGQGRHSRRRPSSSPSSPSTSRSSWPTCRTSCARRSTAC